MARIDTSTIEGYESMTPEERLAALESFEYDDNASELERLKVAVSKANSEAAKLKKERNALLSEEEKKRQDAEEELGTLREKVEAMEKEKRIAANKARLLALGYDESLASETAQAMADGDTDKVFANQKRFLESHDKAYKAKLMGQNSTPPAGGNDTSMSIENLRKMSQQERYDYSVKHPEEYKKLYGGNG